MSRTEISLALMQCYYMSQDLDIKNQSGFMFRNIYEAIANYIESGRASHDFLTAFLGLSKTRMRNMLRKCASVWACDTSVIAMAKKYLKVK